MMVDCRMSPATRSVGPVPLTTARGPQRVAVTPAGEGRRAASVQRRWCAGSRCGLAGLAMAAALLVAGPLAAAPASIQIVQALADGTALTAYVAVRNEGGEPVTGTAVGAFRATVGSQLAEVLSATPFAETGEAVLYLFLVDISQSLDAAQFARIRAALRDWVSTMPDGDQAAILSFGTTVRTLVAPTADRARLTAAIAELAATDPHTALHQVLARGLALGRQRGADLPSRRALVILSDGLDDAPGGMTADEVEAQLAEGSVPIYAIGLSRIRDRGQREAGLATLGRFARRSGGMFFDAGAAEPDTAYATLRERIRAVEMLRIRCERCVADGNRYRLQIGLEVAGLTLTDGMDVRLYPTNAATPVETADRIPPGPSAEDAAAVPSATANATPEAADVEANPASSDLPIDGPTDTPSTAAATDHDTAAVAPPAVDTPAQAPSGWDTWLVELAGAALVGALIALMLGLAWRRRRRRHGDNAEVGPTAASPTREAPAAVSSQTTEDAFLVPEIPAVSSPSVHTGPYAEPQPQPAGPTVALTFMSGPRCGETVRLVLAPAVSVGRAGGCALELSEDDEVSARHARLVAQARRVLVEDLGSTNGTLLNGVPLVAPRPLHDGDVLRLGQTELRIGGVGIW